MEHTIVVAAAASESACIAVHRHSVLRLTTMGEYFRDRGSRYALIIYDDLTKQA